MPLPSQATQSALSEKELVKRSLEAENRLVAALQKEVRPYLRVGLWLEARWRVRGAIVVQALMARLSRRV